MDAHTMPKTNDPRVADFVRSGQVRVALFLPQYTKDPVTGELRGGPVFRDIARALADRIGVGVLLMGYQNPREIVECLKAGACDVAFMVPDTDRVDEVGFSPPVIESDFACLVPAGSSIRRMADADRSGVRIAAVRNHASTLALSRILKQAEVVTAETPDAAFALLRSGDSNAMASARSVLLQYSAKLLGSRVLKDRYGTQLLAMAVPKGPDGSPMSASSSKRPRRRGWCSRSSSAPAGLDSRWRPREIRRPGNESVSRDNSLRFRLPIVPSFLGQAPNIASRRRDQTCLFGDARVSGTEKGTFVNFRCLTSCFRPTQNTRTEQFC